MKNFVSLFKILVTFAAICTSCNGEDPINNKPEEPDVKEQNVNTWVFDDGEEVCIGSVMIYETSDQMTAYFSAHEGLTSIQEFEEADDCTEIKFPVSAVDSEINLASFTSDDGICFISRLPEFGEKDGFLIDGDNVTVSEGKLFSLLENDEMSIKCEFMTLDTDIRFSVYLSSKVTQIIEPEPEGSYFEYEVKSSNISKSGSFGCGFYLNNTWDDGRTFTYSVADINSYIQLDTRSFIEIYVGSAQLLNGESFNVAETEYPFSFKLAYLDISKGDIVSVVVDNNNRDGASGLITLKQNSKGYYNAQFDLVINSGDVTVSGYFADAMRSRNMIYSGEEDKFIPINSATLDISADPCVLYLSGADGEAGPDNYDIKGEVPAKEWRFDRFMSFSGFDAAVNWIDGIRYDVNSSKTTPIIGGNWKVTEPVSIPDGGYVSQCTVMLFGPVSNYAYYYGEIKLIE